MTMLDLSGTSAGAAKHQRAPAGSPAGGTFVKSGSAAAGGKNPDAHQKHVLHEEHVAHVANKGSNQQKRAALLAQAKQLRQQAAKISSQIALLKKNIAAAQSSQTSKTSTSSSSTTQSASSSTTSAQTAAGATSAASTSSTPSTSSASTSSSSAASSSSSIASMQAQVTKLTAQRAALLAQASKLAQQAMALSNTGSALEFSAKTGALATTPHPFGKPGGPGLWHQKGMELPPYVQNIAHALLRTGRAKTLGQAIAIARAATKRWLKGKNTKPEVRAASGLSDAQWRADQARAHAHSNPPGDALEFATAGKVYRYRHGWVKLQYTGAPGGAGHLQAIEAESQNQRQRGNDVAANALHNVVKMTAGRNMQSARVHMAVAMKSMRGQAGNLAVMRGINASLNDVPSTVSSRLPYGHGGAPASLRPRKAKPGYKVNPTAVVGSATPMTGGMNLAAPTSTAGRKSLAKQGNALPDGSFPIPNVSYLKKAIRAVGRAPASKRPAIKRLIKKRAAQLGAQGAIKGSWVMQNATPAVSASDGPRVTGMAKGNAMGLADHQVKAYAKMRKKGVPKKSAMAMAKRTRKPSQMKNLSNVGAGR